MSNGDSLDGFVFPPFIPTASARPAQAPPAAPPPPAETEAPAPDPVEALGGRMTMPWDLETPIVRDADTAPPQADAADDVADEDEDDDGEDLPWLEVPTPREPVAEEPAPAPPAAANEAFPDWMAWDDAAERAAEAEMHDSVERMSGLEDFVPMDDLGGFVAPTPAADWSASEPPAGEPAPFDAGAFPEPDFDALLAAADSGIEAPAADAAADAPSVDIDALLAPSTAPAADFDALFAPSDAPEAGAPAAEDGLLDATEAEAPMAGDWSLDAPEAAPPPQVGDEMTVEVTLEEEPAAHAAATQPFVADEEAVIAAEPAPSAAEPDAEPDPFTAAAVAEAGSAAPVAHGEAPTPFDDVAARLEAIARMLRERPDELLAGGSSDPLALLVTGYVMGYTARGR
jgi:hypothetical protein